MSYNGSTEHIKNAFIAAQKGTSKLKEITDENKRKYYLDPCKCQECNGPIKYKFKKHGKFCSKSCSAKYSNKNRKLTSETKEKIRDSLKGRPSPKKGTGNGSKYKINPEHRICLYCQCTYLAKTSTQILCSRPCARKYTKPETRKKISRAVNERIKNGTHKGWSVRNKRSYAEKFFEQVFNDHGIKFEAEYKILKRDLGFDDSYGYFMDFYFPDLKLDVEIDGSQHLKPDRQASDKVRDEALTKYGITVYRIPWKNINTPTGKKYIQLEIDKILKIIAA